MLASYTVKGKGFFKMLPKYAKHANINVVLNTFEVKMSPGDSSGFRKLWDSVIGYSRRELYISDGFIYVM